MAGIRGGRGGVSGRGRDGRESHSRQDPYDDDDFDLEKSDDPRESEIGKALREAHEARLYPMNVAREVTFNPQLELDDLLYHAPAVATETASRMGQVANVMRSLRVLADGVTNQPGDTNPDLMQEQLRGDKNIWFADNVSRGLIENVPGGRELSEKRKRLLSGASKEVQEAILKNAVQGHYKAPTFAAAGDILGTLRSYHQKDSTYRVQDGPALEAAVMPLVEKRR
jgi:hypothetical protein